LKYAEEHANLTTELQMQIAETSRLKSLEQVRMRKFNQEKSDLLKQLNQQIADAKQQK